MGYLFLALAIAFEVAGTTSMRLTEGFSRPVWIVPLAVGYAASLGLLTLALRTVGLGTAYAIWSGLGTALVVVVGWVVFRETLTAAQLFCVGLIILGVVGLNLFGKVH
jgi:small multidrug resistance pump